jgi:hypothetical protein
MQWYGVFCFIDLSDFGRINHFKLFRVKFYFSKNEDFSRKFCIFLNFFLMIYFVRKYKKTLKSVESEHRCMLE